MIKKQQLSKKIISKISLKDIKNYLYDQGWDKADHLNDRIDIFRGPKDDYGNPLEIRLPSSNEYKDCSRYIRNAINMLALIKDKSSDKIASEINSILYDVFKIRINNLRKETNSLSLNTAADDINALKKLFTYAACSEKDIRPYFERPLAAGIHHADLCQFGHTFAGSFGLTINSPIIKNNKQLSLFENQKETTFERKVLERIIRSLSLINKAVAENDGDIIVNNFDIGLNSRMCEAFLEISQEKNKAIDFYVSWSSKIEVSDDLKNKQQWRLTEGSEKILDYAAEELKKVEPFKEIVIGRITTLHSNKNPMSDEDCIRTATVKHEFEGRIVYIKLYLDKEGYKVALEAHKEGMPIKVIGELYKKGSTWKMTGIENIYIYKS